MALIRRILLLACVACAACKKCPKQPPAAGIVVRDAKTKAPICDATVVFEDGSYKETATSMPLDNACIYVAIGDRPGNYRVTITAKDHKPGSTAVAVTRAEDSCRLQSATVTVELER